MYGNCDYSSAGDPWEGVSHHPIIGGRTRGRPRVQWRASPTLSPSLEVTMGDSGGEAATLDRGR